MRLHKSGGVIPDLHDDHEHGWAWTGMDGQWTGVPDGIYKCWTSYKPMVEGVQRMMDTSSRNAAR